MNEEKTLYQSDRRKNLRDDHTDRRDAPRATLQMTLFKIMVAIAVIIVFGFIIYQVNPSI